jgi:dienelactone hydrolase
LYPFIKSQTIRSEFTLSFLRDEFKDLAAWKREARSKLLELLHYAPRRVAPRPEVVEKKDKGDYVREKVYFNTTPDIRVPAYVLVPKKGVRPFPAIVALHDHGGFYLWGKEKLVETEDEHPALTAFKREAYAGRSIATRLAQRGYLVVVTDMFYWGERRLLLDHDPEDWRNRPRSMTTERVRDFNRRAGQLAELVGRTILAAGFTWTGVLFWDDVRTVDYLLTRPEVDPQRIGCVGLSVGGVRSCHLAALDDRIKAAVPRNFGVTCRTPSDSPSWYQGFTAIWITRMLPHWRCPRLCLL